MVRHTYKHINSYKFLIGVLLLGLVTGGGILTLKNEEAEALSYTSTVTPEFTINQSLTITLSDTSIAISNLAPGTSGASDSIDITVLSNAAGGYNLTGSVGSTTYTSNSLTNSSGTIDSLGTSDSVTLANFSDDVWGYAISTDSGSTWSDYSGLPYMGSDGTTTKTLRTETDPTPTAGDVMNFKIGAKTSTSKAAGTYSNVINFAVTAAVSE